MNKSDLPKLIELITAMASSFGKAADEATFFGYEMALDDLSINAVEAGVRRAIREAKFMPSGAELRELCGDAKDTDRAVLAFAALGKAVSEHGYYATVTFDDPVINAAVNNLGGWEHICCIEGKDEWEKWFRKDFERVYTALYRSGISREMAAPLIGHCDRENRLTGYVEAIKEPLLIASGLPPARPGLMRHDNGKIGGNGMPRIDFKKPDDE